MCVLAVAVGGALLAYREHILTTQDFVARVSWPAELLGLINESAARGDSIEDVEVRSVGLVTTYAWKMPATANRLSLHIERFKLTPVSPDGIEYKRIVSQWPHAWGLPTSDCDVYANPVGLPGADDGDSEHVLLHDKGTTTIYYYYYFNF